MSFYKKIYDKLAAFTGGFTGITHAEDSPHVSGHNGVMMLGVYQDDDAPMVDTVGDYTPFKLDAAGNVRVSGGNTPDKPSTTFTRPANATAYDSGDVVNGDGAVVPFVFVPGGIADRKYMVLGAHIISSVKSGSIQLELLLFRGSFAIAADNAIFNPSFSNLQENYLGSVFFDNFKTTANLMYCEGVQNQPEIVIQPEGGSTKVYGVLVSRSAWTPSVSQQFMIKLDIKR